MFGLVLGRLVYDTKIITHWVVVLDALSDLWAFRGEEIDKFVYNEEENDPPEYEETEALFDSEGHSPVVKLGPIAFVRENKELSPQYIPNVQ